MRSTAPKRRSSRRYRRLCSATCLPPRRRNCGARLSDVIIDIRDRSTYRLDGLVGFEYLDLYETLGFGSETLLPQGAGSVVIEDSFTTRNQFYGADLGMHSTMKRGRMDFSAAFKIGLGVTHEVLTISGQTDTNLIGGPATSTPGGFVAVESNSGRYVRDRFACVPEANFQIGYRLCRQCHAFVAYDLLYWSDVMRPGDQVDHTVNPLQVPILTGGNPVPVAALAGLPGTAVRSGLRDGLVRARRVSASA